MERYAGIWINVNFEKGNDYKSYDEDYTSSESGGEKTLEETFLKCEYGKHYYKEAAERCRLLNIYASDIHYIWLYFNDPETNATDAFILDNETINLPGVHVINEGKAAYIGHFKIS